jgi:hypothetical protein
MKWTLFFSRVAFICNLFFLLSLYIRISPRQEATLTTSTTIIIGTLMAYSFTFLVNLIYFFILIRKKSIHSYLPLWLAVANFLFLLAQMSVYFFLN